ncbi:MAG: TolC family protein [Sandaracinaceae bacterium]|nr:TolC family protein [Sandaracinaceae bacterium]
MQRSLSVLGAVIAPLWLAVSPAAAQDAPDLEALLRGDGGELTSEALATRAVERAPSLAGADASIARVQASVQEVWASIVPTVTVGARYTRLSEIQNDPLVSGLGGGGADALVAGVDDPEARQLWATSLAQQQALGAQTIPVILDQLVFEAQVQVPVSELFLSLLPRLEAAEAAVDAERARRDVVESTLRLRAREAFYGALRARALAGVTAARVRELEEQTRLAERGREHGAVRRSDVLGAQAQLAAARADQATALGMVSAADGAVRSLLGLPPDAPLTLGEDLSAPLAAQPRSLHALVGLAFERRAEVQTIRHALRATRSSRSAAEGARWPALRVAFGAQVANPNTRYVPQRERFDATWDLSVVLAWSPNQTIAADARANAASAEATRLATELESFRDALHREIASAHADDRAASARLAAARASLEAAVEAHRARSLERAEGEATTADVLESESTLASARMRVVDAAVGARLARARLAFATADAVPAP